MKRLRRLWYRCLLSSYQHDALHLTEYIEKAKRDRRTALINVAWAEHELEMIDREADPENSQTAR